MRSIRLPVVAISSLVVVFGLQAASAPTANSAAKKRGVASKATTTVASTAPAKAMAKDPILRVALSFPPKAGLSVFSDDAFLLARLGATESLVKANSAGATEPLLATSWEQKAPTTWRFILRSGVKFHDGSPVDAAAVAKALNAVGSATTPPRAVRGIGLKASVVDATTVEVTTTKPDPLVPLRLSSPGTAILASAAYASTPPSPINSGTGPFRIDSFTPGQRINLSRNDSYWGEKPKLGGVEARLILDAQARTNALRAGELDIAEGVPTSQIDAVRSTPGLDVAIFDLPRTTTLYLNTSKPPFNQLNLRRAVDLAIDRKALASKLLDGAAAPGAGYFGPAVSWDPDVVVGAVDITEARNLVAKAGLPEPIRLWTYPARAELPELATSIQGMLDKAGLETKITVAEYDTLEPKVLSGDYDMFLLSRSYVVDVPDPGAFLVSDFSCAGGYNLNRFCSPTFDDIVKPLATTSDRAARTRIFTDAAKVLEQEIVGVPVLHDKARIGISNKVRGYVADPLEQRLVTPALSLAS